MIRLQDDHWVHAEDIVDIAIRLPGVWVRLAWWPEPQLHSSWDNRDDAQSAAEALSRDVDRARHPR